MSDRAHIRRTVALSLLLFATMFVPRAELSSADASAPPKLKLVEIGADSTAFDVVATLIVGPTEALLFDAQYHATDAKRVADAIQASGKHLKAIVLSHADEDHISGAATIVERFPGTPVYMTAAALKEFNATAQRRFKADKAKMGALMSDSLVTPSVLPTNRLTVDGEVVEVIPDLQGDVLAPSNSIIWIPSLHTVLAGDVVFNGIHPWLGSSDVASRMAWRASLERIASLKPTMVVAGHKKDVNAPDSPAVLHAMEAYLNDFDALIKTSQNQDELRNAMLAKYPDLGVRMLVGASAWTAMQKKNPPAAAAAQVASTGSSARLSAGKWSGTITSPDGNVMSATFDVGNTGSANTIGIAVVDRGSADATDVKFDGSTLRFNFQPGPLLACELKKRDDGSFAGACTSGPASGAIVMLPPK